MQLTSADRIPIQGQYCHICVVGGAGFLGSHLVNHLIDDRKCKVLVIDNLVAGRREFIHAKAKFIHHDITGSEEYLTNVLKNNHIDYLLNYAAYPYVPDSYDRPLHIFNVNCYGALKVINAAQAAGVKGILQVSSAEVYGQAYHPVGLDAEDSTIPVKLREDAPIIPHSTYGASKAAIDALCQVAWRERQTPVMVLRQFNCMGERETHSYVITEIISQLHKQEDWKIRNGYKVWEPIEEFACKIKLGNNSSRDFIYAGDAVRIAVELLERGKFGEVYNLGSDKSIRVYDLAKLVGKVMGFKEMTIEHDPNRDRKWEIWHLQSDSGKLGALGLGILGAITPLEEAIRKTVSWYWYNECKWPWEA